MCILIQVKRPHTDTQQRSDMKRLTITRTYHITQFESDDILPLSPGKTSMCSILCGGDVRAEYERGASPNLGDSLLLTVTNTYVIKSIYKAPTKRKVNLKCWDGG